MTGTDEDHKTPLIWTKDERDKITPIKPFPADKPYLRRYVNRMFSDDPLDRILLVDKVRQMFISTVTLLYLDWECRFLEARRWILSKNTEEDAIEMLDDKVRSPHTRLPEWVKTLLPQKPTPAKRVKYPNTQSYILAANQRVATGAGRGGTASGILVDEAAYQEALAAILAAVMPMATRFFGITTANMGNLGAVTFFKLINEGREKYSE